MAGQGRHMQTHTLPSWHRRPGTRPAWLVGVVFAATLGGSMPAQAAMNISCLMAARVQEAHAQPLHELMVKAQVLAVHDDNNHRNDVECPKQFKTGSSLWLSLNARKVSRTVRPGDSMWLSLRYGEDRSGANWRRYEPITYQEYQERKNGIQ